MTDGKKAHEAARDVARWRTRASECKCDDGTCKKCKEWETHYAETLALLAPPVAPPREAGEPDAWAVQDKHGRIVDGGDGLTRDKSQEMCDALNKEPLDARPYSLLPLYTRPPQAVAVTVTMIRDAEYAGAQAVLNTPDEMLDSDGTAKLIKWNAMAQHLTAALTAGGGR